MGDTGTTKSDAQRLVDALPSGMDYVRRFRALRAAARLENPDAPPLADGVGDEDLQEMYGVDKFGGGE